MSPSSDAKRAQSRLDADRGVVDADRGRARGADRDEPGAGTGTSAGTTSGDGVPASTGEPGGLWGDERAAGLAVSDLRIPDGHIVPVRPPLGPGETDPRAIASVGGDVQAPRGPGDADPRSVVHVARAVTTPPRPGDGPDDEGRAGPAVARLLAPGETPAGAAVQVMRAVKGPLGPGATDGPEPTFETRAFPPAGPGGLAVPMPVLRVPRTR